MGYNYVRERKRFNAKWAKLRVQYIAAGMNAEVIEQLYQFDLREFRTNRNYLIQTMPILPVGFEGNDESKSVIAGQLRARDSVPDDYYKSFRHGWVEDIDNPALALLLKQLSFEDVELLTLYNNICGYTAWLENTRHYGVRTVNQRLMAIRSFAKYASTIDQANIYIQVQISNVPRKKVPVKAVEHMNESVLENLFKQPNLAKPNGRRDQFFMVLMYDVAARCRELLDLKICDVNLGKNASVLLTRKGGKKQSVPLRLCERPRKRQALGC